MRVLVCGGRDFDRDFVWNYLTAFVRPHSVTVVIHGCSGNTDMEAESVARAMKIPTIGYRAEWEKHGKKAGPLRNQRMLDEGKPDLVVAFPGGKRTADMKARARRVGVQVVEVLEIPRKALTP